MVRFESCHFRASADIAATAWEADPSSSMLRSEAFIAKSLADMTCPHGKTRPAVLCEEEQRVLSAEVSMESLSNKLTLFDSPMLPGFLTSRICLHRSPHSSHDAFTRLMCGMPLASGSQGSFKRAGLTGYQDGEGEKPHRLGITIHESD